MKQGHREKERNYERLYGETRVGERESIKGEDGLE